MKLRSRITSVFLALFILIIATSSAGVSVSGGQTDRSPAQETVEGSAILHCFNWSYNNIKAKLSEIAAAGYTAVQTSPVQKPKDYTGVYTDQKDQWWKLYQPLGFSITSDSNWIGTKAELQALCEEAENYGIKVIVDIVANHLANNGSDGGGFSNVSPEIEQDLYKAEYFHTSTAYVNDSNRYTMTQNHMGMPDLNTGNSYVQSRVLGLLKECVDVGVDGFRFDAAKHIELPTDQGCASDFWPYIINGIKSYTSNELFFYGEILNYCGTDISNYTAYVDVTDNTTGEALLKAADSRNCGALAVSNYNMGALPKDSVLWAESHDTYMGGGTSGISDDSIIKAWAIIGSRADSTALFLARPAVTMGDASSDTTWNNKSIAEINKFKNYFDGTTEYLGYSNEYSATYNERGNSGVVISKLDGGGYVKLYANKIADGTYTDQVTGNTFTVSGGYITGTVGSSGVAVVYDPEPSVPVDTSVLYLVPNANWKNDNAHFAMYVFNKATAAEAWAGMSDPDGDGIYSAKVPDGGWDNVIFCRMSGTTTGNSWDNVWNQTNDLALTGKYNCYTVGADAWSYGDGSWSVVAPTPGLASGDINGDGDVDSLDATLAFKYDAGLSDLGADQLAAGDVSGDGEVNSLDATLILKYDAGLIDSF
ncbi:MAG: hypothetical protein IJS94_05560 [Clostridia bacterium]|nr:hypothetical protein [Clostridia bacterium]